MLLTVPLESFSPLRTGRIRLSLKPSRMQLSLPTIIKRNSLTGAEARRRELAFWRTAIFPGLERSLLMQCRRTMACIHSTGIRSQLQISRAFSSRSVLKEFNSVVLTRRLEANRTWDQPYPCRIVFHVQHPLPILWSRRIRDAKVASLVGFGLTWK